ncbi:DMT family transporter [Idiomarina sp. HP20-50]|uniref:DMT family transporter n=1 Tax=Idiomarina sp. HP20-50 TaxID=3070813 RepID=UPI00294B46B3|nr:DMT family transporter [Idiomarina sp. HP20-50]MDV6314998.1 DMT family transporter [Idiomarina sp. HP20-50]
MAYSGVILVVTAALFWGLSGGIAGILINNGWSPLLVSFYRGAIGLFFFLMWLALQPHNSGLANKRLWLWSTIAGLGVAGNFAFYFFSISESGVAIAATLMYCAPIFVYLISFALRFERSTPTKWAAIVLVMIGVMLLTRVYEINSAGITFLGVTAGLLSGLSLALFIFSFKYATAKGSPQAILTIAFSTLLIALGALIDIEEIKGVVGSGDGPLFLLLGVLGGGASFILYIIGLRKTLPALASIVSAIEPVTAALFGVIILGEALAYSQILGMALILVTVTLLGVYSRKH